MLRISVRPQAGGPAMLYFGGNAEDVPGTLPPLAQLFPHHALCLMHYRGFGQSSGEASEAALHGDAQALYAFARKQHDGIAVVGRSLGSGVAARLASERTVQRLALITPYNSIENVAAEHFPWLPVRWLIRDRFDSAAVASRITAPTTLIVAQRDTLIRPERSAQLAAHFPTGVARSVEIPGADHNSVNNSSLYEEALLGALH